MASLRSGSEKSHKASKSYGDGSSDSPNFQRAEAGATPFLCGTWQRWTQGLGLVLATQEKRKETLNPLKMAPKNGV